MSNRDKTMAGKGDEDKCKCDWKGCAGNPHKTQVVYHDKKNGCVDRGKYVGSWPAPFCIQSDAYEKFGVKKGICKGLTSSKYAPNGDYSSSVNKYRLEYHHVIPVESLATCSSLKTNLVLLGWNINDGISNGMCLPYFKDDQIWHALQPHRGSHPLDYQRDVKKAIKPLEEKCQQFCKLSEDQQSKEEQQTLIEKIAETVDEIRNGILDWVIKIHLSDTLINWTNTVLSRVTSSKTGYFTSEDAKKSSIPVYRPGPYGIPRKYLN